jgi:hypothetical protein
MRNTGLYGCNDSIARATPISDGNYTVSISPYAAPPDSATSVPDTDYYRIVGTVGSMVQIQVNVGVTISTLPLDPVLEIVDGNGVRLNSCRLPGDTSNNFNSNCLNDDIDPGVNLNSQLEIKVPGTPGTQTPIFAYVLDWRGDARPDMMYYLAGSGSVTPLRAWTTNGLSGGWSAI